MNRLTSPSAQIPVGRLDPTAGARASPLGIMTLSSAHSPPVAGSAAGTKSVVPSANHVDGMVCRLEKVAGHAAPRRKVGGGSRIAHHQLEPLAGFHLPQAPAQLENELSASRFAGVPALVGCIRFHRIGSIHSVECRVEFEQRPMSESTRTRSRPAAPLSAALRLR